MFSSGSRCNELHTYIHSTYINPSHSQCRIHKDATRRSLDSRRRYLQQTLNFGGYQLSSKRRRPLTEDERETKQVDDRRLLDDEFKQNLVLVSSLLEDDARKDMEAEVERLTNLLSLAPEARSAALAESTHLTSEYVGLATPKSRPGYIPGST